MGARYYSAKAGRFTQLDPVPGSSWGGRSYDYVEGNPINLIDPTGLYATDEAGRRLYRSDYFRPGRYAVRYVTVKGPTASKKQKKLIQELGKKYRCHTCGRKASRYHLDHQPVSKLMKYKVPQRGYPQCPNCSAAQGGHARYLLSRNVHYGGLGGGARFMLMGYSGGRGTMK